GPRADSTLDIRNASVTFPRMLQRALTLGHSPDPDDAFMFYGLAKGLIPTRGYRFEHILQDIQTLNERAARGELDISAISFHAYASVSDHYMLLPSGASMGDGYGPMLVAKEKFTKASSRIKTRDWSCVKTSVSGGAARTTVSPCPSAAT